MAGVDPLKTYSIRELSHLLGVKRDVLYALVRDGRLAASTIGPERRALRIPAYSVMGLFERQERTTS